MKKRAKITNEMSREEYLEIVKPNWALGTPKKRQKEGNRRVANARKIKKHNREFDSALELFAFESFVNLRLQFDFQKKIVLQPGFKYRGKPIRPVTWTVDFFFEKENVLVDTKGWATDIAKLKLKLVKYKFYEEGSPPLILTPKNKDEVRAVGLQLLAIRAKEASTPKE